MFDLISVGDDYNITLFIFLHLCCINVSYNTILLTKCEKIILPQKKTIILMLFLHFDQFIIIIIIIPDINSTV